MWKSSENPDDSGSYRSDYGENHWYTGMSHSTKCTREQIHNTTKEIRHNRDGHDLHGVGNDFWITGVDPQNLRTEEPEAASHDQRNRNRQHQAVSQHLVHSLIISHTVILAGKAHAGLRHCIDRNI